MTFRITPNLLVSQAIHNAQVHTRRQSQLQRQVTTGLRVERPSDDPSVVGQLLASQSSDARMDTDLANVATARSKLDHSVSQLVQAGTLLSRAKSLAMDGMQSTERETLALEVDAVLDQMLSVANATDGNHWLYSGAAVDTQPFVVTARNSDGKAEAIEYRGSSLPLRIATGPATAVEAGYAGGEIFQPEQAGSTLFLGTTGAAPGPGADSGSGQGSLTVRHVATTYASGGVQPGASSAAGDTILGPAGRHVLTVTDTSGTGAFGTVSLNGGPATDFTSADTDLRVTGPQGEVVYVDLSSITPGLNGPVDIAASGTISTDGGASEVNIDFTPDQLLTHSVTGAVTGVDTSNLNRTGTELIEYQGTTGVFEALIELRNDLRNTRGLSPRQLDDALSRRIADLDRLHGHVLNVVGEQSATLETLDTIQQRTEDQQLVTRTVINDLQAADIPEVVLQLQNEQNSLQFTFAASARMFDVSLLDFLN